VAKLPKKTVKLIDLVARGAKVVVQCQECGAETPLDPKFFISRARTVQTLDELAKRLLCSACGSSRITLRTANG
jgi:Zn finger protein HypA/HybF involved in hydrogenase expression